MNAVLPIAARGLNRKARNAQTFELLSSISSGLEALERNPHKYKNPPKATIDFETRSACSIKECGSWRYSLDKTTEVMCLSFRLPYWEEDRVESWWPAFPQYGIEEADNPALEELFLWIEEGHLVEAHNAWFERGIWTNICTPRFGWPQVGHRQWRCSAAKAATYSLPRNLEGCTNALMLSVRKDMEGSKLMKKMCKPRKPKKAEVVEWLINEAGYDKKELVKCKVASLVTSEGTEVRLTLEGYEKPCNHMLPHYWLFSAEDLTRLVRYCEVDVLAEEAVSHRLRDLSPMETEMYLMDQHINQYGFQIDQEAVTSALEVVNSIYSELNAELIELTEGRVEKATQRARMIEWFNDVGLPLQDTQGGTIDKWLEEDSLEPKVRRGLELVRALGRSSTAKFIAAENWVDPATWRIHGGLLYHGAGTGRWSGAGLQPHNFPRGNIKNMDVAWDIIKGKNIDLMTALYDDAMTLLSHSLRGMIIPTPGRRLMVADYAAIEARVLVWLAEDEEALEVFRLGKCIYMEMATEIYGRPITDKEKQADERQMGKQAVLGLGYQMGAEKFRNTLADKYDIHITLDFAQRIVDAYRAKFEKVKNMWWDQEAAAIKAVKYPGKTIQCGKVAWRVMDGFLHCKLPSGRLLGYCDPKIIERVTPWGKVKPALTYMGVDPYTKKWRRQDTYGGMLVENITQATARDLMADAMYRFHTDPAKTYDVILSVHDELIAECDLDKGDVKDFEHKMALTPEWAAGCPVKAEGWTGFRYRK
ncbi:DNA polymerase [Pseudomonas phage ZQG1]|nr:DNA polymerase [Pseudomonas phage ZQG1]